MQPLFMAEKVCKYIQFTAPPFATVQSENSMKICLPNEATTPELE